MKARRKGTNCPFKTVEKIQLKDSDILYDANVMEVKQDVITTHDTLSTDLKTFDQIDEGKHWQDVRERAAIIAMQGVLCAPIVEGVDPNLSQKSVAELAVMQADLLIEQLKKRNNYGNN